MLKLKPLCIAGEIVKQAAAVGNGIVSPQKITFNYHMITLLGIYPKEVKSGTQIYVWIFMFIVAFFTIAKRWK